MPDRTLPPDRSTKRSLRIPRPVWGVSSLPVLPTSPFTCSRLIFLILLAALAFPADTRAQQPPAGQQPGTRVTIGVLELDINNVDTGEARAISERLRAYMGRTDVFQVIERNKMESIMQELGFQLSGACDTDECVIQVGKILGASKMVAGAVSKVGTLYSLQIRIVDIATSRIEAQAFRDVNGIEQVLTDVTQSVANELADFVRGSAAPAPAAQPRLRSAPVTYEYRQEETAKTTSPDGSESYSTTTGFEMNIAVVATGPRRFEVTISDVFLIQSGPWEEEEWYADYEMPKPVSREGLTFSVELDQRGKVIETTGFLERDPDIILFGGLQYFIATTLQNVFLYLPEGDLEPGAVWGREFSFTRLRNTLNGISEDTTQCTDEYRCPAVTTEYGIKAWKIDLNSRREIIGTLLMDMPTGNLEDPLESEKGTIVEELSGIATGTIVVAADSGMILRFDFAGEMSGSMKYGGEAMPMTTKTKVTLREK